MKSATRSATSAFFSATESDVFPPTGGILKRGFDVTAALMGLILISPLFLMLMLLVKLSDRGPIFYGHRRIGHNGKTFGCLKFRTMVVDGDRVLQAYLQANPRAMDEWRATRKLQNDPRVTLVGAVLRKLSLDELPQLINIIRGEMSVVGPRPVVEDELERYETSAIYYLQSRPGLTGLWQVSGRNDVSYESRVAFDTHYVKNWSLSSDMMIIAKTIPAVCLSRGSY
ncbi:sugar transferase [Agrobacterium sp. SHOUNA12C]|uniref:Exopolysaccharide production protein n=2 Tax=Rhizobium rhizogenes TaxID=359 RepID=B9JKY5_RHIR8|nr:MULTISPECIES: sugar transferase [Rhizobium]ACM30577.1 exopolysaccharide production protein [Rhizobium rhizogenes K84]KAA6488760.1 sugar transferase [Agrobacterium sp. ICMP 7243]MCJ9722708.1 sugar transferase [Agrobacterium sp. BETTINA12B]MCJ9756716.1 sugar transferase [Agrobacterium sp. SHOUNA12C]OCJ01635.1 exopolysaccharide biosynthesis protein [Agrobacterium sp. 13-626]OCJ15920.1 exopolysaccharide biosynthesis protein [Agrobacterium sp. B131/95]OCJ19348.1 exopolysaccharide biosynthesis 